MRNYRQAKGFTMIELIVVMVVLGVLVAVTAMRWNTTDATAPYQADLLARNIRHMQMLAMSWGQPLQFTVASPTYSVSCVTASATPPCNAIPVIDPASGKAFSETLVNNVTLAGAAIDIDSLGRPVSGGALLTVNRVYTLTAGAQTWSVTVSPITGFTVVSSP
jgi:prepilin-type N-terminal cleavage/methylation domain-containing protein